MARRLTALLLFVGVLFGAPRPSYAASDFLDFIWGLSGPQLIGVGFGCRIDSAGRIIFCPGQKRPAATDSRAEGLWRNVAFTLAASAFVSTGKNSESGVDYRFGDLGMVAIEPNVSFNSVRTERGVRISHNVGPTYDILFGLRRDFDTFQKLGIKVTPLEVIFHDDRAVFAFNLRLYPDGFTDDEFGVGPRQDYDRPFETVIGFSFGYSFR